MKIAHLDAERSWRGGQAQVLALLEGLRRLGHPSILWSPAAALAERARARGFAWREFRPRNDLDLGAARRAARELSAEAVDVVHLHGGRAHAVGALAARWAGRRPAVVSRRVATRAGAGLAGGWKYRHGVRRYLCVSRAVAETLAAGGVPRERLRVIPSAVDRERWRGLPDPGPLARDLGLPLGARVVGTLAALTPEKGLDRWIEAAAAAAPEVQGRPLHWVLFGEGPERARLERLRSERGLVERVHLPGFSERLEEAMALFDVYALPSRSEGLGSSILEAQAAGVPVVASAVGGVPELLDEERGWLVPPEDARALAAAVAEILERPEEARRRSERARAALDAHEIAGMVEATLAVYREVLAERRAATA